MTARRLTGLLVGFLMLHLSIVGADLSCAQHGDRGAIQRHHASGTHAHMLVAAHAEAGATHQPCDVPAQPDCCRAMTSCAITAASAASVRLDAFPPAHDVIRPALMRVLRSPITSPDPPPPKA
jgi:hypothetical protein